MLIPRCELDHLVIAAASLEAGVEYLDEKLGVTVPPGGAHPLMGTHNRLMQLGPESFLEIIAIDPDAPPPARPRWYALDDPSIRERLAVRPALLTWVVRTRDIETAAAASPIPPGPAEGARRGNWRWKITIPEDGSMPEEGLFPTLIEWHDFDGPAASMADLGCRLESLRIRHAEPARLVEALTAIGADGLAQVVQADAANPPGLTALIDGPKGKVMLGQD